jgi:isoquinoline 1-oxidoreductase beta subunit
MSASVRVNQAISATATGSRKPSEPTRPSRREFLKVSAAAGGGLVVALYAPWDDGLISAVAAGAPGPADSLQASAFVTVHRDGTVTILAKNPELGQGVRTSLPMIVAEELGVAWEDVRVEQAPYDPGRFGPQYAGGSTGVSTNWDRLRIAGAAARELLILAAAQRWGVEPAACTAIDGTVRHGEGSGQREISYGELVDEAAGLEAPDPEAVPLKDPAEYRIIGTPRSDVDLADIVTGSTEYGLDLRIEGMLYAVLERAPTFGGRVRSFDASRARGVPGVRDVVEVKPLRNPAFMAGGVAVVADSTWAAMKGREALIVEWEPGPHANESTESLRAQFERLTLETGDIIREEGDVDGALAGAATRLQAVYEVPFLYHATMEPMNCVAHVRDGQCEIWAPTQVPGMCLALAAATTGLPRASITVHMVRTGGGFGRRLMADYAAEAASVSQSVGAPVQVVCTREDDVRHGYYRPAGLYRLSAGMDGAGELIAWKEHVSTTSRHAFRGDEDTAAETEVFPDALPGAVVPNFRLAYSPAETSVPTGALRGPGKNANTFVEQCFLDEIAHAAGKDPVEIRRDIIGEPRDLPYRDHGGPTLSTGRLRSVLDLAVARSDWGTPLPQGRGRGVAAHMMFGAYVAQIAEVAVDDGGNLRVERVVCAVDCGIVINPPGARAQVEGGILHGLSATLYGEITIADGAVVEGNFDGYPLLPVDFDATGTRVRRLPIRPEDVRSG